MRLSVGTALALTLIATSPIVACGTDDAIANATPEPAPCPATQTACTQGGVVTCATLSRDPSNCGACGKTCANGEVCANGTCALTCPDGLAACDGGCRDLDDDPDACGSCTTTCPRDNATPVCSARACSLLCNPGFGDCDGQIGNGCETDLSNDPTSCGFCGRSCTGMCIAGKCEAPPAPEGSFVKTHEGCTHLPPHRNEDVAADWGGVLYTAASCAGGEIEIAASVDGGATWSTPVTVPGFANIAHLELRGGAGAGVLHVVGATADGDLVYSRSTDAGATFLPTPKTIRTGGTLDTSTVVYEDKVFVVAPAGDGFPVFVSTDGGQSWSQSTLTSPTFGASSGRAAATVSFDGRSILAGSVGPLYYLTVLTGTTGGFFAGHDVPPALTNPAIGVAGRVVFGGDGDELLVRHPAVQSVEVSPVAPGTRQLVPSRTPAVLFVSGQTGSEETTLHRLDVLPSPSVLGAAKTLSGANAHVSAYGDTRAVVSMQVGSGIVTGVVTP